MFIDLSKPRVSPARDMTIEREAFERLQAHREPADRNALFHRFLPLATSLAARYRHTSEPFDDLRQVASLGLLKAIERFDPGKGTAFSSFAVPTILGELRRHFRDTTWIVRVPRDLQDLANQLDRVSAGLEAELGRARRRASSPTISRRARSGSSRPARSRPRIARARWTSRSSTTTAGGRPSAI